MLLRCYPDTQEKTATSHSGWHDDCSSFKPLLRCNLLLKRVCLLAFCQFYRSFLCVSTRFPPQCLHLTPPYNNRQGVCDNLGYFGIYFKVSANLWSGFPAKIRVISLLFYFTFNHTRFAHKQSWGDHPNPAKPLSMIHQTLSQIRACEHVGN